MLLKFILAAAFCSYATASDRTDFKGNTGLEYVGTGIANHTSSGLCKNRQFLSNATAQAYCKNAYGLECLHNEMVFKIYKGYLVDLRNLTAANVNFNTVNGGDGYNTTNCASGLTMTEVTDYEGDIFYRYSFLLDSQCGTVSNGNMSGHAGNGGNSTWTYSNKLTIDTTNYKDIRTVPFECSYTTNYTIINKEGYLYKFIDLHIANAGTFDLELTSYASNNVTITDPINPDQEVIFEVTSTSTHDSSRKVYLERCYLTEFDPQNSAYTGQQEVDIITNGCSAQNQTTIDNNYKTNDGQFAKFRSIIFTVEQNFEQAYVTCDIRFCNDSSCTDPSCTTSRRRRSVPDHVYHAPVEKEALGTFVNQKGGRARRQVESKTLDDINQTLKISFGQFKNGAFVQK